ncbi:hypothetical protein GCM10007885_05290 [Methylobacterium gnaphalii]|nr:hypothetical protein GCM10007885_05290 [Methylobacterium gnaphalii]
MGAARRVGRDERRKDRLNVNEKAAPDHPGRPGGQAGSLGQCGAAAVAAGWITMSVKGGT